MQVDVGYITEFVKCKPYKLISTDRNNSLDEILELWLPPILPEIIKDDFREFFNNKITGRVGWLRSRTDSSFAKFKVEFDLGGYRGIADFIYWDDSLDGRFLERILPLLHAIANCSSGSLTIEQFVALATDLCQWANFPLTPLDVAIITTVNQMPGITVPALARLLHTSYKKTRSRWKRLRRLNILRIMALPNYRSIGLQPVVIELCDTRSVLKSPYLLSKIKLTGGGNVTLYVMVVPEDQLGKLARSLDRQVGIAHSLYLAEGLGHTIAFTHYQCNRYQWDINWRKLFLGAHLLHQECGDNSYTDFYKPTRPPHRPYVLDEKDKRLIPVLMSDARMKLELLASKLNMSLSQVSRRRTKLIDLGVMHLETIMRRVGLIEDVVIRIREEDPRLLGVVRELPQAWVTRLTEVNTGKKQILVNTTLPAGSFAMMRYYIKRYLNRQPDILITDPESGGWPLSFETYDIEQGQWIWYEPEFTEEKTDSVIPARDAQKPHESDQLTSGKF